MTFHSNPITLNLREPDIRMFGSLFLYLITKPKGNIMKGKLMRAFGRLVSTTVIKSKTVVPACRSMHDKAIKDFKHGYNSVKHSA